MRLIWVLNTFRYSAIELTVKSFIENKEVRENIDLIIVQIHDKNNKPAHKYINQLKAKGVKFETIEYKTFFGIPRFQILIKTFKLIAFLKPDLLHIYCERYSFYLATCSRILKIPTVRTVCHIFDLGNGIIPKIRRVTAESIKTNLWKLKNTSNSSLKPVDHKISSSMIKGIFIK